MEKTIIRTAAEKKAAKTAALQTAKHEAKKLKTEEKKAAEIAKLITETKTELPAPPAEIIVDIETTNPKEEKAMENFTCIHCLTHFDSGRTETGYAPEFCSDNCKTAAEDEFFANQAPVTITAPTRPQLVTVITEMNAILTDCKIPTAESYTNEILVNMIKNKELEIVFSDITPTNEGDKVFSHEVIETMMHINAVQKSKNTP
jgi:hypothetical protein